MLLVHELPPLSVALIACHPPGQRIVAVRRGQGGYFATDYDGPEKSLAEARAIVDYINGRLGVSEEQKTTMVLRSMGRWPFAPVGANDASFTPS